MGTHPIFESDFDCLTEKKMEIIELKHGNSSAQIYAFGATVTSWKQNGKEKLFLSSTAKLDGTKAIRGGIPVVFPNFGPWKLGPQHGFARISSWTVDQKGDDFVIFTLSDNDETRKMWDYKFELRYTVRISDNSLYTILTVKNTDVKEFDFTALLHTYFMVENIASLNITGLEHATGHDQLTNSACSGPEKITIDQNVDSIFKNTDKEINIVSDHGKVTLYRKDLPDVVVWNPWVEKAKGMGDFDDEGYKSMVCVEPGYVADRKVLSPGQEWTGSQWMTS